ncbi:MAG: hypothetical protein QG657_171 [Acidobacteriota bacterium]|nr:hypothetical protein [Acidobacteriota bacterium]
MKNYIIGLLMVISLVFASLFYKEKTRLRYAEFPVVETKVSDNSHLHLYVFFSKQNCVPCLEYIKELNELPPEIKVFGVVPDFEVKDEAILRELTGAAFPLIGNSQFKWFIPLYSPTTVGVSTKGEIYFVLPGVPGEKDYIENFLMNLYYKLQRIFVNKR